MPQWLKDALPVFRQARKGIVGGQRKPRRRRVETVAFGWQRPCVTGTGVLVLP